MLSHTVTATTVLRWADSLDMERSNRIHVGDGRRRGERGMLEKDVK
jgi:hypothetical protein